MTKHVALLRAINLGGRNQIAMAGLRDLFAELGFRDSRSLLQSGNVVFAGDGRTPEKLERLLETATAERLGVQTEYFVRTSKEWSEIVSGNPFRREAKADPGHLLVVCLKGTPNAASVKLLRAAIPGREIVRAGSRHLYVYYPDGVGRSKLTATLIERKLGTRGTARNWNTVVKLDAIVAAG